MSEAELQLNPLLCVEVLPAGAYYALCGRDANPGRQLLRGLLADAPERVLDAGRLAALARCDGEEALRQLQRLEALGFIEGREQLESLPRGALETLLPPLLAELSSEKRALLADGSGLCFASCGFMHEAAEELAALGGEMLQLSQRHRGLLANNLKLSDGCWALCDPSGHSELAFYPLYLGSQHFVLVTGGSPQLNRTAFTQLARLLCRRYLED